MSSSVVNLFQVGKDQVDPMTQEQRNLTKMFLFGAGASSPAGIPTINEMTKNFLVNPIKNINSDEEKITSVKFDTTITLGDLKKDLNRLADLTSKYFNGHMDIELMMSLMIELEDSKFRNLFEKTYPEIKLMPVPHLMFIRSIVEDYIRKTCENISSIDYLWPLHGLARMQPMDIFTLNYDGTIEIFCEKNDIAYTDGFDPYWHPENFAKNLGINIYKLHGSLYWFRSESGKTIKVPIKGLKVLDVKYLTDESVSEMMIYPALKKNKESIVYSWISQKFKEQLNKFEVCVVIGYSFRDDDIKNSLMESLSGNNKLWLVLVNPHASKYKEEYFYNDEIASKIVVMDMTTEKALRERNLHTYLDILENARTNEERTWESQRSSQTRWDHSWNFVLGNYLRINHHDRVKWIVERLSGESFTSVDDRFPNVIEAIVWPHSLLYAMEHHHKNNKEKRDIWKKIFVEASCAFEHRFFFATTQNIIKNNNPVLQNDLPYWYREENTKYIGYYEMTQNEIGSLIKETKEPIKSQVTKYLETLNFMLHDWAKLENTNPDDLVSRYMDNKLGLKKWANEIVNSLK